MVSGLLALAAALAGMLLYGVASVAQAFAARRASGADVLRHPAYVAGLAGDGLAWLASVVALARLPLFVVQSLLAGSLAVTVVLARFVLKTRMSRLAWGAVAVVTLGLVLIGLSASAESAKSPPGWFTAGLGVLLAVTTAAGLFLYRRGGSIPLAVVGALGFSGAALGARVWHVDLSNAPALLATPLTWFILAFGILGAVLYARSLERGAVGPATATLWVVEVVFPGAVGLAVLGDAVRPGMLLPALLGTVLAVGASVVLAVADGGTH